MVVVQQGKMVRLRLQKLNFAILEMGKVVVMLIIAMDDLNNKI